MTDARLPAALEAAAIRRSVEAGGGFAAILRKGDPDRGSLLLIVREKGVYVASLERAMTSEGGGYQWRRCGPPAGDLADIALAEFLSKRSRFDADSWLIDLDVAEGERFIVETCHSG